MDDGIEPPLASVIMVVLIAHFSAAPRAWTTVRLLTLNVSFHALVFSFPFCRSVISFVAGRG